MTTTKECQHVNTQTEQYDVVICCDCLTTIESATEDGRTLTRLTAERDAYKAALEHIANPILFFQKEAEKTGNKVDGPTVVFMSKDAHYLKEVARQALEGGKDAR
jgi:hypothetical protein